MPGPGTDGVEAVSDRDHDRRSHYLSLHDCLSLGEIELGLRAARHPSDYDDEIGAGEQRFGADSEEQQQQQQQQQQRQRQHNRNDLGRQSIEEIRRLPYLVRILSGTRPLASVRTFVAAPAKEKDSQKESKSKSKSEPATTTTTTTTGDQAVDPEIDRLVDRLEDVAATHSVAGGIDVVANHLAPSVAKNLSRLPPLARTLHGNGNGSSSSDDHENKNNPNARRKKDRDSWDTEELAAVARDPIAKRKRTTKEQHNNQNKARKHTAGGTVPMETDDALGTSSDEDASAGGIHLAGEESNIDRRASLKRRDSVVVAAEDSQESTVIKTVSELASLVVVSLQDPNTREAEGEADEDPEHRSEASRNASSYVLSLNTDDILSEKAASSRTTRAVALEGSDLSSTIVAIMHNAPILRSRHVASALCRASVPQVDILISRLGANCPASVPSLLLGCIEAYSMSVECQDQDDGDGIGNNSNGNGNNATALTTNASCTVVAASKMGVEALARLSLSESSRVRTKLQSLGVMLDVQLKLSIEAVTGSSESDSDSALVSVACLLLQHLSFPSDRSRATATRNDPAATTTTTAPGGGSPTTESNDARFATYARACSRGAEPSLLLHFLRNPELYEQTLGFFLQTMDRGLLGLAAVPPVWGGIPSQGKSRLVLRALLLLLLVPLPSTSTSTSQNPPSIPNEKSLHLFSMQVKALQTVKQEVPSTKVDALIGLASSCAVLLASRYLATHDGREQTKAMAQIPVLMGPVFEMTKSSTKQFHLTSSSILSDLQKHDDLRGLFQRIVYPIESALHMEGIYAENAYLFAQPGLNLFCKAVEPLLGIEPTIKEKYNSAFDVSSLLHALRRESDSNSNYLVEETKRILGWMLKELTEEEALSLMEDAENVIFIVEATRFLVKPGSLEVPIVLPIHLDMTWSRIVSSRGASNSKTINGQKCMYILQFLYAFVILDVSPRSPFAFDPRSTPIQEALSLIQSLLSKSTRDYLLSEVSALIRKHCPEFRMDRSEQHLDFHLSPPFDDTDCKNVLKAICICIRDGLHRNDTQKCKSTIELLYLQAKAQVCDSDVYCAVTNALLSSPHSPLPTYRYNLLCRDPIICLKFPLSVWKCRSLRRIALSVLENLLLTNNAIVLEESKSADAALEFLVARDAIIVRCLLAILHEGDSKSLIICPMTTSIIRWLIQGRPGLVALLVKQGLREQDVDWLVENVPEAMNDSQSLLQILERNSLTAAERLVAADTIIRIAIVHGQAKEVDASQLILTAVHQLVDSFYLILGPVGLLPVDALFNAESSIPITQISQKAAFRILKSLARLRGVRNQTRRDCSIVLQKLTILCKSELQGAVTGRRKHLLKELYDAAVKAEK